MIPRDSYIFAFFSANMDKDTKFLFLGASWGEGGVNRLLLIPSIFLRKHFHLLIDTMLFILLCWALCLGFGATSSPCDEAKACLPIGRSIKCYLALLDLQECVSLFDDGENGTSRAVSS